jgi:hypothetical protein
MYYKFYDKNCDNYFSIYFAHDVSKFLKGESITNLRSSSKEEAQSIFDQLRKAMEDYHNAT